ncbi:MAG: hypothetical protein HY721_07410 [Planctomycetes bacterium]|nr:hypothetical protein [Planctomycetota bacterium]
MKAAVTDFTFPDLSCVVLSPHVASASARAVRALRETAAGVAARALRGEPPPNVVNGVAGPSEIA